MSRLNNLLSFFAILLFVFLPFQVNTLVYQTLWGRGFINPYTSIWLTAFEFILLITALIFIIHLYSKKKALSVGNKLCFNLGIVLFASLALSLILSPFPDTSFQILLLIKLSSLLLLYLLIVNKILKVQDLIKIILIVMSFEALLGTYQFIFQSDLGLHFLGEPFLSSETPQLARMVVNEQTFIRAYGTFPHPNVFAGFLVTSFFLTFLYKPKKEYFRHILFLILFLGLLVSFSRAAFLGLVLGLLLLSIWKFQFLKKKMPKLNYKKQTLLLALIIVLVPIFLFWISRFSSFFDDGSLKERIDGIVIAIQMFIEHPWGVGINHFTLFMDEVSSKELLPWGYQPVHNVFILMLAEAGVIGLLSLIALIGASFYKLLWKTKEHRVFAAILIALLIISLFDHYLFSLDQGRFLIVIILGMISIYEGSRLEQKSF